MWPQPLDANPPCRTARCRPSQERQGRENQHRGSEMGLTPGAKRSTDARAAKASAASRLDPPAASGEAPRIRRPAKSRTATTRRTCGGSSRSLNGAPPERTSISETVHPEAHVAAFVGVGLDRHHESGPLTPARRAWSSGSRLRAPGRARWPHAADADLDHRLLAEHPRVAQVSRPTPAPRVVEGQIDAPRRTWSSASPTLSSTSLFASKPRDERRVSRARGSGRPGGWTRRRPRRRRPRPRERRAPSRRGGYDPQEKARRISGKKGSAKAISFPRAFQWPSDGKIGRSGPILSAAWNEASGVDHGNVERRPARASKPRPHRSPVHGRSVS